MHHTGHISPGLRDARAKKTKTSYQESIVLNIPFGMKHGREGAAIIPMSHQDY